MRMAAGSSPRIPARTRPENDRPALETGHSRLSQRYKTTVASHLSRILLKRQRAMDMRHLHCRAGSREQDKTN
jgi:hypothetical protein